MAVTENDIYQNIVDGNLYLSPNIKGTLSMINDFVAHPIGDQGEYQIDFGTIYCEATLAGANETQEPAYRYFKDGSYIKLELNRTWSGDTVPMITALGFSIYFGIKDTTTGEITEYRSYGISGLPTTKRKWYSYLTPQGQVRWTYDNIAYQQGDTFRWWLGWWSEGIPKLRNIFAPYIAGGGAFNLDDYTGELHRNILDGGIQAGFDVATAQGQIIAEFLAGDSSTGTVYPGDDSTTGGGDGDFYSDNEDVPFSGFPNIQPIDFGFNCIYNPSINDVKAISRWLWSDDFTENIKMNFISPFDNILTLAMIPIEETIETELSTFIVGNTDSNIQIDKVTDEFITVDCGTLNIREYWGNFLDYDATFSVWLPFIGYRSLKPDDMVNGTISIKYKIDLLNGASVAEISTNNNGVDHVLYSYPCNVFYQCAISGANYIQMYNQQLNATTSGINNFVQNMGKILTGGLSDVVGGAVGLLTGQSQAKREYETAKPEYGRGGNSSGNSGMFSIMKPYIIKCQPIGQTPKNYNKYNGIPSMICYELNELVGKGYTEIDTVIVDTLNSCTSDEKSEILNILKGGVIL